MFWPDMSWPEMFRPLRKLLLAATALAPLAATAVDANPLGPQVVGGSASVQGQGTATVTVTQQSNSAIINWNTFNIGAGETTRIIQPSASSVELDRVTGGLGPSQIFGALFSNGHVFVVNADGFLFGPGAKIDAAGFLATTSNISNSDFMAGRYNFAIPGNPAASIVNQGTITAQSAGFAALVAPGVRNTGTITAWLGQVGLASANTFALDLYGDRLIQLNVGDAISSQVIDVSTGQPLKSLVGNEGTIKANGGRVELTAVAARQVVDSVINNSGVIEANSVGTHNGMIVLEAATAATTPAGAPLQLVNVSGTLSAAGQRQGTTGGTVVVTGENVALSGATIDASGQAGGGKVLIGGDTGGGHPSALAASIPGAALESFAVPTATTVSVDAATVINASATGQGNGGKVVVWSNQATTFYGLIAATGGAQSGNGGFVETSGGKVNFAGIRVDTSAPAGTTGTWLVDPTDLTVDAAAAATINADLATTSVTLQTTSSGASGPGTQTSGAGDIIVDSPLSWTTATTLTLNAYNNIAIDASITAASGGLTLNAGNAISAAAAVNIGTFTLQGGAWTQIAATLPAFSANDFTLSGGSFLRALGGDGSSGSPYQITDVYGLQGIGSSSTLLADDYVLANNIDASGTANWNGGAGFVPIGNFNPYTNTGVSFSGTLNGQGNTISNLTVDLPSTNDVGVGLFSSVGAAGIVENLGLLGESVSGSGLPGGLGPAGAGGLVGVNFGTVTNAHATGAVSSPSNMVAGGLIGINEGVVSNSYSSGTVTGSSGVGGLIGATAQIGTNSTVTDTYSTATATGSVEVGGLIGHNGTGTVTQSYATGAVTAGSDSLQVGGLIGRNDGTVTLSYATGAVAVGADATNSGGLIGTNNGAVDQSYSTGAVTAGTGSIGVGGLVGYNPGTLTSSYWDITTSGIGSQNGVGNVANASGVTGLTTADFGNTSSFAGWSFGTLSSSSCSSGCWVIVDTDGSLNNAGGAAGATRPMLLSEYSTTITNPHQLQLMELDPTASYTLANNVDLGPALTNASDAWGPNGTAGFVPIAAYGGNFTGTFQGQGNTISNLTMAPTDPNMQTIGLFGTIGQGGQVSNLMLNNVTITANPNPNITYQSVGALAGENSGIIDNVTVGGVSSINGGTIAGVTAGGLVGQNGNCCDSNGNPISGASIANSSASVAVSSGGVNVQIGGLVGQNLPLSLITNSLATGPVSATGTVTNQNNCSDNCQYINAGGLVGQNFGTISGPSWATALSLATAPTGCSAGSTCYDGTVTVSSQATGGGLVGYNDGIISNAFAIANVVGAAGVGTIGSNNNNQTTLGGLVGQNSGQINASFAGGTVGSLGMAALQVGGLVSQNSGTISWSFASVVVSAGANSMAGGLVGGNSPNDNSNNCSGCYVGDGDNNTAAISNSGANGSVTVEASSIAGGLVGVTGRHEDNNGISLLGGSVANSTASGAVSAGDDSIVGGLVGVVNIAGTISASSALQSSAQNTSVSSTGANSIVGGLVGVNAGSVTTSSSTAPVNGVGNYVGGLIGINIGTVTQSTVDPVITVTGANSVVGGIVGLNVGSIASTTATNVTINASGSGAIVGGVAGINGSYINPGFTSIMIANSSFPNGTIAISTTATGSGFSASVGATTAATTPAVPGWLGSCTVQLCTILAEGTLGQIITVDADPETKIYGNSDPTLAYAVASGDLGSATFSGTLTRAPGENVGSYAIGEGNLSLPGGYEINFVGSALTISPATLTVTGSKTYDSTTAFAAATFGTAGTISTGIGSQTLVLTGSGSVTSANAGAAQALTLGTLALTNGTNGGLASNYQIASIGNTGTINPEAVTIAASTNTKTYDGTTSAAALPTVTTGTLYGVDGAVLSESYTTANAGTALTLTPSVSFGSPGGSGNYSVTYANNMTGVINPATLFYVADAVSIAYGAAIPALTGSVTGLVNGQTLDSQTSGTLVFSTAATSSSNAGSYAVTGSGLTTKNTNYVFAQAPGNANALTITPPSSQLTNQVQIVQNLVQNTTPTAPTTGEVINTQTPTQPSAQPGQPHGAPGPASGPGGLPPQFGAKFFVPPPLGETRYVKNEVVLQIPAGIPAAELQAMLDRLGLTVLGTENLGLLGVTTYRVQIGHGGTIGAVIHALSAYQIVVGAQANYTYRLVEDSGAAAAAPALAQATQLAGREQEGDAGQYALSKLGIRGVHRLAKGTNVAVAVIDSQIDLNDLELRGTISEDYDATGTADRPQPHGTGMAGAIAAHSRLMGIAPAARLYAVDAFSNHAGTAESTTYAIIKGLDWAVARGVRVINMSFAGPRDPSMERTLHAAHDRGIVLVAAAGNDGPKSPPLYPGADPDVIAVTATDSKDKVFPGANRGRYIAVAAPGVDILVPAPEGAYQLTTGTSVASAEVSGIVALLLDRHPNLTPDDVRGILTSSARHLGRKERDDVYGAGLVDPAKALQVAAAVAAAPAARRPPARRQ